MGAELEASKNWWTGLLDGPGVDPIGLGGTKNSCKQERTLFLEKLLDMNYYYPWMMLDQIYEFFT